MRPRKVVLCVGSDEAQVSERLFLLRTRGKYIPLAVSTTQEALALLGTQVNVVLMIVQLPLLDLDAETLHKAKLLHPGLRTFVISDRSEFHDPYGADVFMTCICSTAELLERASVLCARKRGPRKKPSESASQLASKPRQAA